MEIKEAIETVEYARAFNKENTALMRALDVLIGFAEYHQEAEKNENGCKYCRDGDVIVLDSCSAVRIERDGQNYVMGGCDWEHEINYCPMCGRQLRHLPKDVQYDDSTRDGIKNDAG